MINVCEHSDTVYVKDCGLGITYFQDHNLEYVAISIENFASTSVRYIVAYAICSVLYVYDSMYLILCKNAL